VKRRDRPLPVATSRRFGLQSGFSTAWAPLICRVSPPVVSKTFPSREVSRSDCGPLGWRYSGGGSDGNEHEYDEHDAPPPVSRVRLGTDEDLRRDFGSKKLLIGSPVTSKPPAEDMLVQPKIPDRGQRIASIERSLRRRKAGSKESPMRLRRI